MKRAELATSAAAAAADWDWEELDAGRRSADRAQEAALLEAEHAEEVERAYRRGLIEGEETAREAARREVASVLAVLTDAMTQFHKGRESWEARLEENLVALAVGIARRILERELSDDPSRFEVMARKAVAAFPAGESLKIRLHPRDLASLTAHASAEPGGDLVGRRAVRWIADEEVVPGGCVVEGPDKIVDGRVDEALQRVFWSLTDG